MKNNVITILTLSLMSSLFSQTAGLFGEKGESLISIEGSYDSENIDGGKQNTTAIGSSYLINGNFLT